MMTARGPMGCAGSEGRGRAAHWLFALLGLILALAASTQARALPRLAFDASLAVQRDLAQLPRQLEADLPDLVETAASVQIDSDAGVPGRVALADLTYLSPRAALRPSAVLQAPPRAFNPRAPPSLR